MVIDLTCAAILLLFGLVGAARGFVRQLFSLAAFILIALFAVPLGVVLARPIIAGHPGWPTLSVVNLKVGTSLAVAAAIYMLVKLIGGPVHQSIGSRETVDSDRRLAPWNRYWGAAFGIVKTGIPCWLALCFFVAFPRIAPSLNTLVERSWSVKTTRLFNPFERWIRPETRTDIEAALIALWKAKACPAAWAEIARHESVQRVLQHERIVRLLDQGKGDFASVLADEQFRRSLGAIDWRQIKTIADRARTGAEAN